MPGTGSPDLKRTVGANIAQLRLARGLSAGELARRAGVGKATLSRIEAGAHNPTIETLYAITVALDVPLGAPLRDAAEPLLRGTSIHAELIAQFDDACGSTEFYRVTVPANRPPHPAASGPGLVKVATVFAGTLAVATAEGTLLLSPGDSARWDAHTPESYAAHGPATVAAAILLRHINQHRPK